MEKIREWSFPAALLIAWMLAAAWTTSFLIDSHPTPQDETAVETQIVAS